MLYFKNTLSDMKIDHAHYVKEWSSDYQKIISLLDIEVKKPANAASDQSINISSPGEKEQRVDDTKEEDTPENKLKPAWAKKLYRDIAKVSHPDKTFGQHNSDKMNKCFQEASEAFNDNNFEVLVDVALEMGISVNIPDDILIKKIEKRIEKIKEEISEIEKSHEWLWGESLGIEDFRLKFLKKVISHNFSIEIEDYKILNAIRDIENI